MRRYPLLRRVALLYGELKVVFKHWYVLVFDHVVRGICTYRYLMQFDDLYFITCISKMRRENTSIHLILNRIDSEMNKLNHSEVHFMFKLIEFIC